MLAACSENVTAILTKVICLTVLWTVQKEASKNKSDQ